MLVPDSSRLRYQFISDTDQDFLFELDQNPEVMKYLTGGVPTSKADISNVFIPRLYAYRNINKGWGLWKATVIDTQQDIGWILIRPMEFFSETPDYNDIEIGWRFKQNSWGKGYATEAAQQVMSILSQSPENQHFSATALIDNKGSINMMKKLGMKYMSTYMHSDDNLGELEAVLYKLTVKQT